MVTLFLLWKVSLSKSSLLKYPLVASGQGGVGGQGEQQPQQPRRAAALPHPAPGRLRPPPGIYARESDDSGADLQPVRQLLADTVLHIWGYYGVGLL